MGKHWAGHNYSLKTNSTDFIKAKASSVNVHFKNTVETANAIRGVSLTRARAYLKNVLDHKECVPFRTFKGGVGRCGQAKQFKTTQVHYFIDPRFHRGSSASSGTKQLSEEAEILTEIGVVDNKGRWPEKSAKILLDLLGNAQSNIEYSGNDSEEFMIYHIQVSQAPIMTRRTYRAHGRINPYIRHPCHIQVMLKPITKDN